VAEVGAGWVVRGGGGGAVASPVGGLMLAAAAPPNIGFRVVGGHWLIGCRMWGGEEGRLAGGSRQGWRGRLVDVDCTEGRRRDRRTEEVPSGEEAGSCICIFYHIPCLAQLEELFTTASSAYCFFYSVYCYTL
jgi:hypothetical protein